MAHRRATFSSTALELISRCRLARIEWEVVIAGDSRACDHAPMASLHPEIEAYESGWLDVGDEQQIFYEQCGNPKGMPVVVLHGGPGSGCSPSTRRFFDPSIYRIVLFDQ